MKKIVFSLGLFSVCAFAQELYQKDSDGLPNNFTRQVTEQPAPAQSTEVYIVKDSDEDLFPSFKNIVWQEGSPVSYHFVDSSHIAHIGDLTSEEIKKGSHVVASGITLERGKKGVWYVVTSGKKTKLDGNP